MEAVAADALVLFGITGDLAHKKIFPAVQGLIQRRVLDVPVVGVARAGWGVERLRERIRDSLEASSEGVDEAACGELERLEAVGCLASNTVIVHGVAIDADGWRRVARSGAGAVWCPASNRFLFGRTAAVREYLDVANGAGCLALGTDSRLTGSRDLLDEIREAASLAPVTAAELLRMVTSAPAGMLRTPGVGHLAPGACADLVVIPPGAADAASALLGTSRRDILLTVV